MKVIYFICPLIVIANIFCGSQLFLVIRDLSDAKQLAATEHDIAALNMELANQNLGIAKQNMNIAMIYRRLYCNTQEGHFNGACKE